MSIEICKVDMNTELSAKLPGFVKNCSWDEVKVHTAKTIRENLFTGGGIHVCRAGHKIVGHGAIGKTYYYPLPEIYPWVSTIFVDEAYRGHGICGMLIDYTNGYAKALGFDQTYIPTEYYGIYEKYGYQHIKEIENYGGIDHLFGKKT